MLLRVPLLRFLPLRVLLLALLLPMSSAALEIEEVFPSSLLSPARAEELLTAERIGPPALRFDARTTTPETAGAKLLELEAEAFGKDAEAVAAPDALRRYGQLMTELVMEGRPTVATQLFVADHVGLPHVPQIAFRFLIGGEELDVPRAAEMLRDQLTADDRAGSRLAVTLRPLPEERAWIGVLWRFEVSAELDPFPRRFAPGDIVTLPGSQVDPKTLYVLFMSQPGIEVLATPLEVEDGRFAVDVTMPRTPGVYRLAVAAQKKNQMPDNPFFFSVHVGEDLPTAYRSPIPEVQGSDELTLADWEDALYEGLNAVRTEHGLNPVRRLPEATERMREILAEAPAREVAAWRYFRRALHKDPLPEQPHGLWQPSIPQGRTPAEALWVMLENPVSRMTMLAPENAMIAVGAASAWTDRHQVLMIAMEPAPDAAGAADQVFEAMQAMAPRNLHVPETLEAELDALAADVASGAMPFKAAMGPIKRLARSKQFSGDYRVYTQAVPPGTAPDTSTYELPSFVRYLAIGDATGDLGRGDGLQWTVLLVVLSQYAKGPAAEKGAEPPGD